MEETARDWKARRNWGLGERKRGEERERERECMRSERERERKRDAREEHCDDISLR